MGAGAVIALCSFAVQGGAPMMKTQAPGFYRMMLGDFEVTALNDGVVTYSITMLTGKKPEQLKHNLSETRLTDPFDMSYNAFLINTGSKLVLIDTGTGGKLDNDPYFHGAGHLMANLRAAGYRPEQIDEIYITHNGEDHVGGLTIGAERAFPNAILRASKSEEDIYLDPAKTAAAFAAVTDKAQAKAALQSVEFMRSLCEPYIKAGKFQSIDEDVTLVPGIRALATHGHTPGHTSYIVESKGQTLIVMGDLVLWGEVQFAHPSAHTLFNADPKAAIAQRLRVFKMAANDDSWVAGAHLSFPGIGHVRSGQGRYFWVPINYSIPK